MAVVASLSQGRTAAAQCGLFTHKSVPVIFEPPCITKVSTSTTCFGYFDLAIIRLDTHVGETMYTMQYKSQLSKSVQYSVIQRNTKQSLVSV